MKTGSYSEIEVLPFFVLQTAKIHDAERATLGPSGCPLINEYLSKGWELVHISAHYNQSKDTTVHAVVMGKLRVTRKKKH